MLWNTGKRRLSLWKAYLFPTTIKITVYNGVQTGTDSRDIHLTATNVAAPLCEPISRLVPCFGLRCSRSLTIIWYYDTIIFLRYVFLVFICRAALICFMLYSEYIMNLSCRWEKHIPKDLVLVPLGVYVYGSINSTCSSYSSSTCRWATAGCRFLNSVLLA